LQIISAYMLCALFAITIFIVLSFYILKVVACLCLSIEPDTPKFLNFYAPKGRIGKLRRKFVGLSFKITSVDKYVL
jgi:hypothetical protein